MTEKAFEQVIFKKGFPTDEEIKLAINHQFTGALQLKR
jgi:hypothetical protein